MKVSKSILLALGVAALVGACAPYPPAKPMTRPPLPTGEQTITSEQQRQVEENRQRLEQESRRQADGGQWNNGSNGNNSSLPAKPNYPTAAAVPGKPGFVFNPYTHNIVDVKGIASGRLCRDPEDLDPTHKFRVP